MSAMPRTDEEIGRLCAALVDPEALHDNGMALAAQAAEVIEDLDHRAASFRKFIEALPCPDPQCSGGSVISTGPDPQNDACEWCYMRHMLLNPADGERSDGPEA